MTEFLAFSLGVLCLAVAAFLIIGVLFLIYAMISKPRYDQYAAAVRASGKPLDELQDELNAMSADIRKDLQKLQVTTEADCTDVSPVVEKPTQATGDCKDKAIIALENDQIKKQVIKLKTLRGEPRKMQDVKGMVPAAAGSEAIPLAVQSPVTGALAAAVEASEPRPLSAAEIRYDETWLPMDSDDFVFLTRFREILKQDYNGKLNGVYHWWIPETGFEWRLEYADDGIRAANTGKRRHVLRSGNGDDHSE